MVNISKSGNAIKFTFTDSDHYLYGNGQIETPVNSLSLVVDESKFVTFKKAASNDTFIIFDPANSNLSDKAGVIEFYKTNMVGSTGGGSGSGVTPSEVQEMIDESISGMSEDIQSLELTKVNTTDFNAYSATTNARLAEDEEVTAAALNNLDERIGDPYQKVSGLTIEANEEENFPFIRIEKELEDGNSNNTYINDTGLESTFDNNTEGSTYSSYIGQGSFRNSATDFPDDNVTSERSLEITTDGFRQTTYENYDDGESGYTRYSSENEFNYSNGLILHQYWYDKKSDSETNSYISIVNNKEGATFIELTDTNERTASINPISVSWDDGKDSGNIEWSNIAGLDDIDAATSGKVDTSAITTSITSGSTDSEIPTAKATYDAITAATTGGGATYSAGTNISIDTANTINCTLPITANTNDLKGYLLFGSNISVWGSESNGRYQIAIGKQISNPAYAQGQVAICPADTSSSSLSELTGEYPIGIGHLITSRGNGAVAIGDRANANGNHYVAIGYRANATGTTKMNLNDQIKVDTNNQVYIKDKTNTTDVCIQDAIAALGGLKFVQCTQNEYDALVSGGTVDSSTIYFITNVVS